MKSKSFLSCLMLIVSLNNIKCIKVNFSYTTLLESAKNINIGAIKDTANRMPSTEGIADSGKNLVAGYPLEGAMTLFNGLCSSALATNNLSPTLQPNVNDLKFQLIKACKKYNYPFLKVIDMLANPDFNHSKKLVIMATGWTTAVNESKAINAVAKAFNCRNDVNFVALDLSGFMRTLYTWSAYNTEIIGKYVAEALKLLIIFVPLANIHLIGHSLGAHIVGAAGRHFQLITDQSIPRITGLDPAKPCFNEGEALSGLSRGDAVFIDVIHSNPGILGKREPLGDIDFYPGGLDPLPNGCVTPICAHNRGWKYYTETIYPGNAHNFMGVRCSSLNSLKQGKCLGKAVPMGYSVPTTFKGNYFMEINKDSPYGMGSRRRRSLQHENCGKCKQ